MYDPKTPDMWAKNTATSAQNQTRVLSKHRHIINNLRLFPQKHTFSAYITEKCNTEYSTEHKIQGKQTEIKRTDPYTTLIASAPFPMRPRKKNAIPICRTDMSDRNNKKRTFERPLIDFQLKTCCKKHWFFAPNTQTNRNLPQKTPPSCGFFKDFSFIITKSTCFSPTKTDPRWNTVKQTKNHRKFV